jgi:hypothetical protein
LARVLPIAFVAPVSITHLRPVDVSIAHGKPEVAGLCLSAMPVGKRFVSLISTTEEPNGVDGHNTIPFAWVELKHGSNRAFPLMHRHASSRLMLCAPLKHDPRNARPTRYAGLPLDVNA